ncbi:hypothetical protein EDD11_000182 [Mortierella claussenii]|nr:hypothetical protein EDD11_000182 [Mortierella claussenii]
MTRITATLIALTVALNSQLALLLTQAFPVSPVPASVSAAQCVIGTPQGALQQGLHYEVHFKNCRGRGNIHLRYGAVSNLNKDTTPACANVDFASQRCIFTPQRTGPGFSFSAIDASGKETFSGPFLVVPALKTTSTSGISTMGIGKNTASTGKPPMTLLRRSNFEATL